MTFLKTVVAAAALIASPALAADFVATGPYAIPTSGTAGPASTYPITFSVAGLLGTITDVNFTLTGLSHQFPGDLDILLVAPGGQNVLLMSDAGGTADVVDVTYTFDQQALMGLSAGFNPSGSYLPTNFGDDDVLAAPAPAGPYGSTLNAFNGLDPNGIWNLYVFDDAGSDVGSLSGATLSIVTAADAGAVPEPATWAMLMLGFGAVGYTLRKRPASRIRFA